MRWLAASGALSVCSSGVLLAAGEARLPIASMRGADEPTLGRELAIEDASGRALSGFHAALRRAQRQLGQARVVWWGASHTASDGYVGFLREHLQQRFGDAGAGFVIPVRPFPGWDHQAASVRSGGAWRTLRGDRGPTGERYGFAGFAVEAREADAWGSVEVAANAASHGASSYEIAYLRQPGGGSFEVRIDGRRTATVDTEAPRAGAGYARFRAFGSRIVLIRTRDRRPVRLFGVAVERERAGVVIDTLGLPGSRARAHLRWHDGLYCEQLRGRRPDLAVLAYGTNESEDSDRPTARYEGELRRVLARVRATVPHASCLLVGPSDRPVRRDAGSWAARPLTADIIAVQRRVAAEQGCGFFDLAAFMGGPLSMLRWVDAGLAQSDHIHFTRRGHRRLAAVLARALLRDL